MGATILSTKSYKTWICALFFFFFIIIIIFLILQNISFHCSRLKKKKKTKHQRPCWPNLLFPPVLVEIRKAVSKSYRIY